MSDRREASQGVNILIIGEWPGIRSNTYSLILQSFVEGGGARGLSSLVILGELVARLQRGLELTEPPGIREHFDIVAGTGTGAVIACLVGRLGLPVKQAMAEYTKIAEVFSEQKLVGTTAYSMTKLQNILKLIVKDATGDENTGMIDVNLQGNKCQVMVFAMSMHNMNAGIPVIFRSYHGSANQMPDCPIWQALSATMAHPGIFKPVEITSDHLRQHFVDGGLGCNNPTAHVLAEVKSILPGQHVSNVVCIGAGHPDTIQLNKTSLLGRILCSDVLSLTKRIALDAEKVANEMDARFRSTTGVYFRFSVDQGVQNVKISDWEKLSHVSASAQAYMRGARVSKTIDEAVHAIVERRLAVEISRIDGAIQSDAATQPTGYKACPAPSITFTGRQDVVEQIISRIAKGDTQRRVFVLHGLGGAGKTQLALKAVDETRHMWTDVVFVDATSNETATATLAGFAKEKGVGHTYESALKWIANQNERWLMVIDNADDPSVDIKRYSPTGRTGSILITTRISQYVRLASGPDSIYEVAGMKPDEAMELLLRTAMMSEGEMSDLDRKAGSDLFRNFGYLALAIMQAGAYICCSRLSIAQYHDMFVKHRQATLEMYNELLVKTDDYHKSVYTTWHMSYKLLSTNAQQLLRLLAFMHHSDIVEDIFRRAAQNIPTYKPHIPETKHETQVRNYVAKWLEAYCDPSGTWDTGKFSTTMTELLSYSLISYDRVNRVYSLHVLVHDWSSTVIEHGIEVAIEHTALLLAVSIDYEDNMESLAHKRAIEVHVGRILEWQTQPSPNNAARYGQVYYRLGKWKQKENMEAIVVDGRQQALGEEHTATLTSMNNLALTYTEQGRYRDAAKLQEQVVEIRKRVSGHKTLATLKVMRNLANTYYFLGRYTDAQSLHQHILDTFTRMHGRDHHHTLLSMHSLALTYQAQGRYEDAEALLLKVVDAYKRVKGDEHPNTLTSMHVLASTHYDQGRYDEAESMQEHVVEVRKRRLGDEHPDTLNTISDLALTYSTKGRYGEAEVLGVKVLEAKIRVYGGVHPETLISMDNLAGAYYDQCRYEQAEELQKQVLEEQHALEIGHPRRLLSMRNLLKTYRAIGERRRQEYEALERQIEEFESGTG
ncbi:kinesin light chain [Ceratobasidium sp. AG-Ba]|nr:kinesin light chain [Ceratobasidium sp. AG-Ba]QRW10049.1 kinesin light chain [Ceratobasidium sp. AG-Ba]